MSEPTVPPAALAAGLGVEHRIRAQELEHAGPSFLLRGVVGCASAAERDYDSHRVFEFRHTRVDAGNDYVPGIRKREVLERIGVPMTRTGCCRAWKKCVAHEALEAGRGSGARL